MNFRKTPVGVIYDPKNRCSFFSMSIKENICAERPRKSHGLQDAKIYFFLYICTFCVQSGKFDTCQNIFTRAPPMVPVTIIRYDWEGWEAAFQNQDS